MTLHEAAQVSISKLSSELNALQLESKSRKVVREPPDQAQIDRLAQKIQEVLFSRVSYVSRVQLRTLLNSTIEEFFSASMDSEPEGNPCGVAQGIDTESLRSENLDEVPRGQPNAHWADSYWYSDLSTIGQNLIGQLYIQTDVFSKRDRAGSMCGSRAVVSMRFVPSAWLIKLGVSRSIYAIVSRLSTTGLDFKLRTYNVRNYLLWSYFR